MATDIPNRGLDAAVARSAASLELLLVEQRAVFIKSLVDGGVSLEDIEAALEHFDESVEQNRPTWVANIRAALQAAFFPF